MSTERRTPNRRRTIYEIRATNEHWPIEIEPLCYTPEEFEAKKKQIGIVIEAIKEGMLL
ncbi:MAG: hypothetical protein MUO33_09105 [Sedimentisphaerales bacterium]|nr:hypothetical protein [Sedimentisphaerales bacterium]